MIATLSSVQADIAKGKVSRTAVVETALERAADPAGVGALVFTRRNEDEARLVAQLQDQGCGSKGPLSGLPVSIKDLFDVAGEVTAAGSTVLADAKTADCDAIAVARLKKAGAVIVGRTNMTEFAFSGVGLNRHFGTPPNPYNRTEQLLPGGSSSGAAVSVSDGMALAALGSDTGGSIRIPAALCGLTGFKPTQNHVSRAGMFPLSSTLDCVGVIAAGVSSCHAVNAIVSCAGEHVLQPASLRGVVFALPKNYFLDAMDAAVGHAFERSLSLISSAGARIIEVDAPEIHAIQNVNATGGFAAAEAYKFHRDLNMDTDQYDPLVWERILRGKDISHEEYAQMAVQRETIVQAFASKRDDFDAMLSPTVPIVAPKIALLMASADEYRRINLLLLRNPSIANFLDLCSVSLPCHLQGESPVGLMLTGWHGEDERLFSLAMTVESALAYLGV